MSHNQPPSHRVLLGSVLMMICRGSGSCWLHVASLVQPVHLYIPDHGAAVPG